MITLHMTKPQDGVVEKGPKLQKNTQRLHFPLKLSLLPVCGMLSYIKCIFLLRGTEQGKASCTMWSDLLDSNFSLHSHQKLVGGLVAQH